MQRENREEHENGRQDSGAFFHLLAGIAAAGVIICAAFWLYASDAFRASPKMEIYPENHYKETLRVVTDADYEPFSYVDGDGVYLGLDVELMAELANRLKMNLDLLLTDWDTANAMLKNGSADILMNMETDSVADDKSLTATIPTAEKQYVVYGREKVDSVAELYGRRVVSLHSLPELGLQNLQYVNSYAKIFEGLKNGAWDFAICPIQVGNSFLENLDIRGVYPSYAVAHVYGALVLRAENAALRDRLNGAIKELQEEGFLERLDAKWVNHRYENTTPLELLKNHPGLAVALFGIVASLILAAVVIVMMRARARAHDAYTRQLMRARDQAEAANRAKSLFLSNMSHDIRTPMNAILGYTDLALREGTDPEQARGYMEKVSLSGRQLLSLINDVLEMSRIESGKMELTLARADLRAVMNEVRDLFDVQMKEKGIAYTVDAESVRDPWVSCDKTLMDRVLLNLISNAYKFTPEGGAVSVTLTQKPAASGEEKSGDFELRVKDTGIGMDPKFVPKVFTPFERERTSTVSGTQGTGLGMAITKSIVELMGGSIAVNTAPGKGTEFIVKLKLAILPEPDPNEEAEAEAGPEMDFTGMKLLLVDDIEANREIASRLLTEMGFSLDTAANGQEAVDRVKNAPAGTYDAVLMDVQMPVMNGHEATRAIRALGGAVSKIPIVAMTANAFQEDVQAAKEAGMDGHIAKPIEAAAVRKALQQVLKRHVELGGRRVLLAEDAPLNAEIVRELLQARGMSMDHAGDGKIAVEKFEQSPERYYDAILMDVRMPVMDGLEATRAIRALDRQDAKKIPIIAMTGNASDEDARECREAGMDTHLVKPVEPARLYAALEEQLLRYLPASELSSSSSNEEEAETAAPSESELAAFYAKTPELDFETAMRYSAGEALLKKTLQLFYEMVGERAAEIETALREGDYDNYTIKVHALKSAARLIGAMGLSEEARVLEAHGDARADEDLTAIREDTPGLLARLRALGPLLAPLFEAKEAEDTRPLMTPDELEDFYAAAREYADAFSLDELDGLLEMAEGYRIPEAERERFERLKRAVRDADWEAIGAVLESRGGN